MPRQMGPLFCLLTCLSLVACGTSASPGVKAGDIKLDTGTLPRMIKISGGSFRMGTDSLDPNRLWREYCAPSREVTLSPYRVAETLVTYGLYLDFLKDSDYRPGSFSHPEDGPIENNVKGPDSPVIYVNWYEAILFCNWLSIKQGLTPVYTVKGKVGRTLKLNVSVTWDRKANGYRLLTQAENEYLLRDGGKDEAVLNALYQWKAYGLVAPGGRVGSIWNGSKNTAGVVFLPGMQEWTWSLIGKYSGKAEFDPEGPDVDVNYSARVTPGFVFKDYFYAGHGLPGGSGDFIGIRLALNAP